mmetsp:Transcript_7898/g.29495  ORF Transcript_7898/g.29495 Transcript_7898/m.29495 type:complete len:226 (+) Transcript_7898:2063-2740(+)
MPPKKSQPTLSWESTSHINFNLKISSQSPEEEPQIVALKIKPTASSPSDNKLTNFHKLFLRLASNSEKPPKKAAYAPTYQNSSIFRVTNQWIVGGDLVDASGKNGAGAVLDYSGDMLKVTKEQLNCQDRLKKGSVILPSRNQYEFGSIFAILLDSVRHLQGDVIVIGHVEEGLAQMEEALTSMGYLNSAPLEGSTTEEGNGDPELQTIEKDKIVVETCEVVPLEE